MADPPLDPEQPGQSEQPEQPEQPDQPHDETGLDLARQVARGLAGRTGERRRRPGRELRDRRQGRSRVEPQVSGAHPDDRDPQTLDSSLGRFVAEQGWQSELRVHGVFSRWDALVGREVAQHARPEAYAEGRLSVRTDSTAWATQMKLLAPDVVRRLNEVLGEETVTSIEVRGPQAPSWGRGRFRVRGRGPRDTYG